MNLKNLIKQLPNCIQNMIFYYITLHPIAIAFKLDYNNCTSWEIDIEEDIKYYGNSYNSLDYKIPDLCDNLIIFTKWYIEYIKPYKIIKHILYNYKNNICKIYYKSHMRNRLCIKDFNPIFNKIDKYCLNCIRQINIEYKKNTII